MDITKAVDRLCALYGKEFRGKSDGRFAIDRETLTKLMGVVYLPHDAVRQLNEKLAAGNLVMVDMEHAFAVLPRDVLLRLRQPTRDMIAGLLDT